MKFKNFFKKNKRIFLDYASTTPIDPRVEKLMNDIQRNHFANPSAIYKEGVMAQEVLDDSREEISKILKIKKSEVFFTGSGTESNNLALFGVLYPMIKRGEKVHAITSKIEHPSILETFKTLEDFGVSVTYLPVEENGIVSPESIAKNICPETRLISIMYANNEIGTIQPIRKISNILSLREDGEKIYFHTDASQAPLYLNTSLEYLGVDLMTLDSSKIYGPKGIGLLLKKRSVSISPLIHGGGQESGIRSGTENLAGIAGMAKALFIAENEKDKEIERLSELRDEFIDKVLTNFPRALLNGDKYLRLPNNANICFPGIDSEFAVLKLDSLGLSCSSSSSCRSRQENNSSYVIEALGRSECQSSSLRFTLGRFTSSSDIKKALDIMKKVLS